MATISLSYRKIYFWFTDAASSGYIVINKCDEMRTEEVVTKSEVLSWHLPIDTEGNKEEIRHDSLFSSRNWNRTSRKHRDVLLVGPTHSVIYI